MTAPSIRIHGRNVAESDAREAGEAMADLLASVSAVRCSSDRVDASGRR